MAAAFPYRARPGDVFPATGSVLLARPGEQWERSRSGSGPEYFQLLETGRLPKIMIREFQLFLQLWIRLKNGQEDPDPKCPKGSGSWELDLPTSINFQFSLIRSFGARDGPILASSILGSDGWDPDKKRPPLTR